MAQVIDAGGKRKASSSGKVFTGGSSKKVESESKRGGIAALREDIGANDLVPQTKASNTLSSKLPIRRSMMSSPKSSLSASVNSVPVASGHAGLPASSLSLPMVNASSFVSPVEIGDDDTSKPSSYWESVERQNEELRKKVDEAFSEGEESDLMPDLVFTSGVPKEPGSGDFNRMGEEYVSNYGSGSGLGATRQNDRWESAFGDMGASPYEVDTLGMAHDVDPLRLSLSSDVDNGLDFDLSRLTSPKVSGDQLKEYAAEGLVPGIDTQDEIEKINPDRIYTKGSWQYSPNLMSRIDSAIDTVPQLINSFSSNIGRSRELVASLIDPYEMIYNKGGQSYRINGPEFDRDSGGYLRTIFNDLDYNDDRFFKNDSHDNGGSWTQFVKQTKTVNPDGEEEVHYGKHGDLIQNDDASWTLTFDDGTVETMTSDEIIHYYDRNPETYEPLPDGSWKVGFDDGSFENMSDEDIRYYYEHGGISDGSRNDDYTYSMSFPDGTVANMSKEYVDSLRVDDDGNPDPSADPVFEVNTVNADGLGIDTEEINGGIPESTVNYTKLPSSPWLVPESVREKEREEYFKPSTTIRKVDNASSFWLPNFVMDDGTVLDYYDVLALANDTNGREENEYLGEGNSIDYDIDSINPLATALGKIPVVGNFLAGLAPTNAPRRFDNHPIEVRDDGTIDFSGLLDSTGNRFVDWFSESYPIMNPYLAWPSSISRGYEALKYGINPNSYDPATGSYAYMRGERDENGRIVPNETAGQRLTTGTLASAVPITEEMVGPVGDKTREWTPRLFGKRIFDGTTPIDLAGRIFAGSGAEGNEELIGNIFEEGEQQGLLGMYGNYLDELGRTVPLESQAATDAMGNPMRDPNTPLVDRLYNAGVPMPWRGGAFGMFQPDALANNVNSWISGALISTPTSVLDSIEKQNEYANDMDRLNDIGLSSRYREPVPVRRRRSAPENFIEQYR